MEQLFILCIVLFAGYFFVRGGADWISWLVGSRHRAYRQLASRFRGRYESRGLSEPPTVSFPYEGSHVRVGLAPTVPGQPQPPRTRVVVRFARGIPFRLELYPLGRPAPAQLPKGTRLVRSGFADFDRTYVLQSNDGDIASAFLQPQGSRGSVEDLRRIAPPGGMLVSINPERLLVQVDRNLGSQAAALNAMVLSALRLHDHLMSGVAARLAEGIQVLGAAEVVEPPTCKVCGQEIAEVHVLCGRCRTPHHADCWAFVGGCSIFGCGGKQSAPSATPATGPR